MVPWESPEGLLEVLNVRTFRGPSRNVAGTSRAGWEVKSVADCFYLYFSIKFLLILLPKFLLSFLAKGKNSIAFFTNIRYLGSIELASFFIFYTLVKN